MSELGKDYYRQAATRQEVPERRIHTLFNGEPQEFLGETIYVNPTDVVIKGILREVACRVVYALRPFSWYVARKSHGSVPSEARNTRLDRNRKRTLDRFSELHLPNSFRSGVLRRIEAEVLDPNELSAERLKTIRPKESGHTVTVDDSEIIFRTKASLDVGGGRILQSVCVHALSVVLTSADTWRGAIRGGSEALSLRYVARVHQVDSMSDGIDSLWELDPDARY